MFYVRMAWRSLRSSRGLTVVMILALSLGIGTWYTQRQIFAFIASKMPVAPAGVYHVALERGDAALTTRPQLIEPLLPSILLTPRDAQGVLSAGSADRTQTITFGAPGLLEPEGKPAETVRVRYATRDLFALFDIPLVAGAPWSASADTGLFAGTAGDEVVIDERLARRLFGSSAVLGRRVRLDGADLRVVGVVASTNYDRYRIYERFVPTLDAIYLPLAHATAAHAEPDFQHVVAAAGETGSVSVWVELPTAQARADFVASAETYLASERAAGRRAAPRAVTLRPAHEWQEVFRAGGTIMVWPVLAALCLLASVINLIRMLIVKFSGRRHDLGLLRAFGARQRSVMGQLLLEAVLIGLISGLGGLVLGVAMMPLAIMSVASTPGDITVISVGSALVTVGASVGAALIAALYPAWRLVRGTPMMQLRGS